MDVDDIDDDKGKIFDPSELPVLLKQYYARIFPYDKSVHHFMGFSSLMAR